MATPASGAISMADMNTEITRAGSTASVSMSTLRTRYGGSGAISFSDLRKAEGFTITCGTYSDKFGGFDGYYPLTSVGSATPDEAGSGTYWNIQFAANSYMSGLTTAPQGTGTSGTLSLTSNDSFGDTGFTTGFAGTDVTRIVIGGTSVSLGGGGTNFHTFSGYDMPASGSLDCLVKF
jgi:hypothetical protein